MEIYYDFIGTNETSERRVKNLKRKVLGFFGTSKKVSLDELAQLLVDANLAETTEEAKQSIPNLDGVTLSYGYSLYFGNLGLRFDEIKDILGNPNYRISIDHKVDVNTPFR